MNTDGKSSDRKAGPAGWADRYAPLLGCGLALFVMLWLDWDTALRVLVAIAAIAVLVCALLNFLDRRRASAGEEKFSGQDLVEEFEQKVRLWEDKGGALFAASKNDPGTLAWIAAAVKRVSEFRMFLADQVIKASRAEFAVSMAQLTRVVLDFTQEAERRLNAIPKSRLSIADAEEESSEDEYAALSK